VSQQNLTEKLAASILARDGVAAIWQLQVAAADAHRTGHLRSAAAILEIAEAAEEAWLDTRDRLRDRLADVFRSLE
jgi:hypothetical protein